MQHPDEGTIHAWLDDALPDRERSELEAHVAGCTQCQATVAEARGMIAGASRIVGSLDVVRGDVIPKTAAAPGRRNAWRFFHLTPGLAALAATLMVAVASLLAIRHRNDQNAWTSGRRVRPAAAAAPAAPVAPVAPSSAPAATTSSAATPAPAPAPSVSGGTPAMAAAPAQPRTPRAPGAKHEIARQLDSVTMAAAPPQAAKVDSAETAKKRDTTTARLALESVVVTAAPSVAVNSANNATGAGSANRAQPESTRRAMGAMAPRRAIEAQAARRRVSPVFATTAEPIQAGPPFTGCYEIMNDSVAWRALMPQRFVLQHAAPETREGPLRNVARALTPAGLVDTSVRQGSWRPVGPNAIAVSWPSAGATAMVTMYFGAPAITGDLTVASGVRRVEIRRADCRP